MSSNELHITRANYVEFFLLYVDGELTAAQNDAVEAFTALHPDLQEELDILLTIRLDAEPVFFNKDALMADSMKQTVIDESLLLYIDNELKEEEKALVEEKLESDPIYQYQHSLLRQTKLPAETISYPDKEELYRKEERKIRPAVWFSAAAAVFVLLTSGYMWYLNDKVTPQDHIAVQPSKKVTTPVTPEETIPTENTVAGTKEPGTKEAIDTAAPSEIKTTQADAALAVTHTAPVSNPATTEKSVSDPINGITATDVKGITNNIASINNKPPQQQVLNNLPVTSTQPAALNSTEATTNQPGISEAVAIETENNKRGSVKGFLRKATRFIERRTGVSATNEDDELLIGAVAIKLK